MIEVKDFILDIEQKFPVNSWKINGIHLWPILRIRLFFYLEQQVLVKKEVKAPTAVLKKNRKKSSVFKRVVAKTITIFKYYAWLLKLPNKKNLFVALDSHRISYKGKHYNRFFDTLIDKYQLKKSSIYLEQGVSSTKNHYAKELVFTYKTAISGFLFLNKIRKKPKAAIFKSDGYSDFLDYLSEKDITKKFAASYSEKQLKTFGRTKLIPKILFFKKVLQKINPDRILILCYYSENVMALTAAANQLGIETIEMQHGPQAAAHLGYGSWSVVPKNGYDMLPRNYWCWDASSKNILNKWVSKNSLYNTRVVGNPWVDCWKEKKELYPFSNYVLYSLQPKILSIEQLFPSVLIQFIKEQPYKWFIRLHPRQLKEQQFIKDYLEQRGVLHLVNIENATNDPLPQLLSNARMHITNSSGVALEANLYNVFTVLMDKIALHYFSDLIASGKALYLNPENKDFQEQLDEVLKTDHGLSGKDEFSDKIEERLF